MWLQHFLIAMHVTYKIYIYIYPVSVFCSSSYKPFTSAEVWVLALRRTGDNWFSFFFFFNLGAAQLLKSLCVLFGLFGFSIVEINILRSETIPLQCLSLQTLKCRWWMFRVTPTHESQLPCLWHINCDMFNCKHLRSYPTQELNLQR